MIVLIAELKGKISSSGSNLSDRLEDKLTGDFFGALRYIPFSKVMREILKRTRILHCGELNVCNIISGIDIGYWINNISFWPYNSMGELDVILDFDQIVIGIEVKLYSGLSSDDDIDQDTQSMEVQSINQLARESRILKEKIINSTKPALLLFIAPEDKCYAICKDVYDRNLIADGVELGYLSWEEILEGMEQISLIEQLNPYEKLIVNDLVALLKRKGLERFKRFNFECKDIDSELWFQFDNKMNVDIKFDFNKVVDWGGHYEFR